MYDAESKVSQPSATANDNGNGCPSPNKCKGLFDGKYFFAVIIIFANNL